VQLSRAVRNRTTGVLYVLDEPSIGLHPSNVDGLLGVIRSLLRDGNSVVTVDHDVQVLREADWLVEIGPGSGQGGGTVLATGTVADLGATPVSRIGGFLTGRERVRPRERAVEGEMFTYGRIRLSTRALHTVHPLKLEVPRGRLTAVTGVSGSGKTILVLESLVPALRAKAANEQLPAHVRSVDPAGVGRVHLVDASPIGVNVRSTVATYTGVLDEVRRAYAATPRPSAWVMRPGTSPTTPAACAAPPVTAPARSTWMCSSCPTSTSSAPSAADTATPPRPPSCAAAAGRPCPSCSP
jgi:excinuclease ABC subunit A